MVTRIIKIRGKIYWLKGIYTSRRRALSQGYKLRLKNKNIKYKAIDYYSGYCGLYIRKIR